MKISFKGIIINNYVNHTIPKSDYNLAFYPEPWG